MRAVKISALQKRDSFGPTVTSPLLQSDTAAIAWRAGLALPARPVFIAAGMVPACSPPGTAARSRGKGGGEETEPDAFFWPSSSVPHCPELKRTTPPPPGHQSHVQNCSLDLKKSRKTSPAQVNDISAEEMVTFGFPLQAPQALGNGRPEIPGWFP